MTQLDIYIEHKVSTSASGLVGAVYSSTKQTQCVFPISLVFFVTIKMGTSKCTDIFFSILKEEKKVDNTIMNSLL